MPTQNKYGYQLPTGECAILICSGKRWKTGGKPIWQTGKPINPNGGTVIGRKELSRRDLHRINVASKKARRVITINK